MCIRFALAAALAVAAPAFAQSSEVVAATPDDLAGTWVWLADGRTLFVLDLEAGPNGLTGTITRPANIGFSNHRTVMVMDPSVVSYEIEDGGDTPSGRVLRYDGAAQGGERREHYFRLDGEGGATLDIGRGPVHALAYLRRLESVGAVSMGFDGGRLYAPALAPIPDNAEMADILSAETAAHGALYGPEGDARAAAEQQSAARRARVRQLLDEGQLQSGQDFHAAATVFRNSGAPAERLLAHTLAMAAMARGRPGSPMLAATTLDRYLHSIERPQIFGTYPVLTAAGQPTLEPYDPDLLPDAVPTVIGIEALRIMPPGSPLPPDLQNRTDQ